MNQQEKYVNTKLRLSTIFLVVGVILFVAGILLQISDLNLPFNVRIISGLGIFLVGVAIAYRVKYGSAKKDPLATQRLVNAERDERMVLIRAKAGNRAYFCSAILTYGLLLWVSYAIRRKSAQAER